MRYYIGRLLVRIFGLKRFSYSSINEDNIIDWLTGYKKNGIYIDVGANNPDSINNTRLFYERGWRGINIEPTEKEFKLLQERRVEDTNYNCAIGSGEINFFEGGEDNTGNTCDTDLALKRGIKNKLRVHIKNLAGKKDMKVQEDLILKQLRNKNFQVLVVLIVLH